MAEDVCRYVATCPDCQTVKASNTKPIGLLTPLPRPDIPWSEIAMDFVTGLPELGKDKFDSIFVVVDRATKMAHFVPCHKDITAE